MVQLLKATDHSRDSAGLTYVYPVVSRRAGGVSVGVNLNPNNACNWRCVYCQVPDLQRGSAPPIDLVLLEQELNGFLLELRYGRFMEEQVPQEARRIVDVALSGNGEPTSAREFPQVIALIARVLEAAGLADTVKIRLITNGSLVSRNYVREGLALLGGLGGEVWFKVDGGTAAAYHRINSVEMTPESVAQRLAKCASLCATWVQTCLFAMDGQAPTEAELVAYLNLLSQAGKQNLKGVLLYGLARPPMQPEAGRITPLPATELEKIATRIRLLGLTVKVCP